MHQWEDKLTKIYENLDIQKTLQLIHFILIKILKMTDAIRVKIKFKCQMVMTIKCALFADPPTLTLHNILQDILDTTTLRYEIP